MDLANASVLVAGGASGLGAATAKRLAGVAAHVVVADRNEALGQAVVREFAGSGEFVSADVTDTGAISRAIEAGNAAAPLRAAVVTAGVGIAARTVTRDGTPHDLDEFTRVIQVNLIGTFNVLRLAAASISQHPADGAGSRGCIVLTSSVASTDGQVGQAAYSASKGGVAGLTLPVARDLAPAGIRVNTICPGSFETAMFAGISEPIREKLASAQAFPKRLGDPDEYASLVQHLIENDFFNGAVIRLDAGMRMP